MRLTPRPVDCHKRTLRLIACDGNGEDEFSLCMPKSCTLCCSCCCCLDDGDFADLTPKYLAYLSWTGDGVYGPFNEAERGVNCRLMPVPLVLRDCEVLALRVNLRRISTTGMVCSLSEVSTFSLPESVFTSSWKE